MHLITIVGLSLFWTAVMLAVVSDLLKIVKLEQQSRYFILAACDSEDVALSNPVQGGYFTRALIDIFKKKHVESQKELSELLRDVDTLANLQKELRKIVKSKPVCLRLKPK